MAKRIGNLNAQITADGLQFRAELVKCEGATARFSGEVKTRSDEVVQNLQKLLEKGQLGKLHKGLLGLAGAVGGVWAAFEAGQAIRAQIDEFFTTGAERAKKFEDSLLELATNPKKALESTEARIRELEATIAGSVELLERNNLGKAMHFDLSKEQGELKELVAMAARLRRTINGIDQATKSRADRAAQGPNAPHNRELAKRNETERQEANRRFHAERHREAERLKDLDEEIARDKLAILREQINGTADEGRKLMLRRQAEEMDSAIKIAALKRQLEDELDFDARERLRQRIALEIDRGKAAVASIKPDDKPKIKSRDTPGDLKAISRNSAEATRAIIFAAQSASARKRDDEAKRQTKLQQQVVKVLQSIDAHVQAEVEISLL